ncbi:MAG: hypothetical protein PHN19_01935 [Patescibacteria group bacterium]|nr:hypothetical protein [Patescibacteria group bacterium]
MALKKVKKISKKTITKKTLKKKPILSLKKKVKKQTKPAKPIRIKPKKIKKIKKQKKGGRIWLVLPVIILVMLAGYFVVAKLYTFWPFSKSYNVLEDKVVIKKDIPIGAARLDWDNFIISSEEKISDTDDEKKNLLSSSWSADSSRLVFLDEDKSLSKENDVNYPWKGKLFILENKERKDLANFFYHASANDLKIIGKTAIDIFNNERKIIKTNFSGDNLTSIDLDKAVSYDLASDGRKIVLIKNSGEVVIKDLQTGQSRSLGKEKNNDKIVFLNPRWSHDGNHIAFLKRLENKDVYQKFDNFEVGVIDSKVENLADFKRLGVTYIPENSNVSVDMIWSANDKFLLDNVSSNVYSIDPEKTLISNDEDSFTRMKSVLSPTSDKVLVYEYYKDNINSDPNHAIFDLYVMNLDGSKRIELLHREGDVNDGGLLNIFGTWSPDGEKIIYVNDRKLWMVGSDGTSLRQVSKEDKDYSNVTWSTDGQKLSYISGNEVWLINFTDKPKKEEAQVSSNEDISVKSEDQITTTAEEEYLKGQTFSPNGKSILSEVFSKNNEGVTSPSIYYSLTNLENKESKKIGDEIYSLSSSYKTRWFDDGTVVYDNLMNNNLDIIWMDKDGNLVDKKEISNWNKNWFGWDISNDGKEVVALDSNNRIYLYKKGEVDPKIIYEGDIKSSTNWIRWSPDKKYIALLKGDKDVWLLRIENEKVVENKRLGGNNVFGRDGGFDPESFVLWSPDSTKMVVQDSGNVLDVESGLIAEGLLPCFSTKFGVKPVSYDYKWSPNSLYIAFRQDNNLSIIKPDGSDKKTLAEKSITTFDWSADSSRIFFADDMGISVVNNDGSENKRLIEKSGKYSYLKLSVDNERLVYIKDGELWIAYLAK